MINSKTRKAQKTGAYILPIKNKHTRYRNNYDYAYRKNAEKSTRLSDRLNLDNDEKSTVWGNLVESVDDKLFKHIITNPNHVLRQLLPEQSFTAHNLQPRRHDRTLLSKQGYLFNNNFTMLYYWIVWQKEHSAQTWYVPLNQKKTKNPENQLTQTHPENIQ